MQGHGLLQFIWWQGQRESCRADSRAQVVSHGYQHVGGREGRAGPWGCDD